MDPTRLITEDDRFGALLLRSGLEDEPDPGALRRAEVALGLGVAASLGGAAAASHAASLKGASAQSLAKLGAASAAKWIGAGVVSGVLVASGIRYAVVAALEDRPRPSASQPRASQPAPVTSPRHEAPPAPVTSPRHEAPPTSPSASVAAAPSVVPARSATASSVTRAPARPASPSAAKTQRETPRPSPAPAETPAPALAGEVAVLERARGALFAGKPDAVLQELIDYERGSGGFRLVSEAELLRIEAMIKKKNLPVAKAMAKRSLDRAPNGPYARRLREIVALP